MKRIAILLVGVALLFASSSALAAGSSTCQAYNPQLCSSVSSATGSGGPGSGSGTLPFTGVDVGLLVAGGIALVGAGVAVRVLTRRLN
jgi:hypothetical protein